MSHDNDAQREFWNADPGENWVTFQADLDQLHREVADLIVAAAAPRPGEHVLDIGCGAGALAFDLARSVGAGGHVHGVDISALLLAQARLQRDELAMDQVTFTEADAQDAVLPAASYDLAVSRFGVMFFADPVTAFRNIAHSLKPAGRLIFAAWSGPEHNPWFRLPQIAAEARLGAAPSADPTAPGPMAFRDGDRVLGLLSDAGFDSVAYAPTDIVLHHPGGMAAVRRLLAHIGPLPRMMRDKGGTEEDMAAILAGLDHGFSRFLGDDGLRIPGQVHLFTADLDG